MKRLLLLLLVVVLLVGCEKTEEDKITAMSVSEEGYKGESYTVVIENNKFNPVDLEVKVGDRVEWVNKDSAKHSVTFEDVRVDEVLPEGGKVAHVFKEAGEARYFCKFHPGMKGSVFVK